MVNKKNALEGTKKFLKKRVRKFSSWFTDKEHPRSRLNKNVFFYDLLKIIGLSLVYLIIHANVDKLNNLGIPFIRIGGIILLVMLFFIFRKAWHIILNLKYAYRGLNHGTKAILAIVLVLILFLAFLNQEIVVNGFSNKLDETNFSKLSPIELAGGFSLGNFSLEKIVSSGGISYSSIKDLQQNPANYVGQTLSIKGKLNNRMGGYSLEDNDGYWVWIEDNCIESQRDYSFNSQTYAAKGNWLSPKNEPYSFGWGMEEKYRLSCSSALS
jgi:hypothetical protein